MKKEFKVPQLFKNKVTFIRCLDNINQLEKFYSEFENLRGFAFFGRSNVGKSSLINALFGKKTARVSNTPGRTRAVNVFTLEINEEIFYIFDLPGYGHAEVSKTMKKLWNQMMGIFFSKSGPGILFIQIQDARHPQQKADLQFSQFIQDYTSNDTFLLFNKIDKLKKQKEKSALGKIKKQIFNEYDWVKQIYYISAESKEGLVSLEQAMEDHLKVNTYN